MTERLTGRRRVERNKAIKRKNPLCKRCLTGHCAHRDDGKKCFRAANHIDHVKPLAKGGEESTSPEHPNLQGLCEKCHELKTQEDFNQRRPIGLDGWPIR